MKQLVVIAAFAAFASNAPSAVACDWNRTASAQDEVVATADPTPQDSRTCSGPECPAPQPASVASKESPTAVDGPTPIALIAKGN